MVYSICILSGGKFMLAFSVIFHCKKKRIPIYCCKMFVWKGYNREMRYEDEKLHIGSELY